MESHQPNKLNVIFLPYPGPGHMNPMIDTARLFAKHGVNVTIITTQANALTFQKAIDNDFTSGHSIKTHVLQFPASQVGLPHGIENLKGITSPQIINKICQGVSMLQDQIEQLFLDLQPDCLVTDMLYTWTVDSAAKLHIPRLFFYSSSYIAKATMHSIRKHKPHEGLVSDTAKFLVPDLPHNIELTTLQIEEQVRTKHEMSEFLNLVYDSESRSYGTLCNSFHELESDYEQLQESTFGVRSWSVGPVSAWVSKFDDEENKKEEEVLIDEAEWLSWLNSKPNESVLYVSFGSVAKLPYVQLVEIAHGLENSGHYFIWVIRKNDEVEGQDKDNFLQDFEQRMREGKKGYIIWNWAPQKDILKHPGIGAIMTHCGWNTILETVCIGLPMITWPLFSDQFYNEKLIVDVLKIGVAVGAKVNKFWTDMMEDAEVKREEIVKAVKELMGSGEESEEMRKRARKLSDAAKRATQEGGSSYNNLMQLIDELKSLKISKECIKINH